jgi:tetratricopeptide (TPR) repeat protein
MRFGISVTLVWIASFAQALPAMGQNQAALQSYNKGIEALTAKRYSEAVTYLTGAIAYDRTYAEAYEGRGNAYDELGEYGKALTDFDKALKLKPGVARCHYNRGLVLLNLDEFDRAVSDLTAAAKDPEEASDALAARGDCHSRLGKYEKALEDFNKSLTLAPNGSSGYAAAGWFRATCKEDKYRDGTKALAHATKACKLTGWNDYDAVQAFAAAQAELGNFAEAIKWQRETIRLCGESLGVKRKAEERLKLYEDGKSVRE